MRLSSPVRGQLLMIRLTCDLFYVVASGFTCTSGSFERFCSTYYMGGPLQSSNCTRHMYYVVDDVLILLYRTYAVFIA